MACTVNGVSFFRMDGRPPYGGIKSTNFVHRGVGGIGVHAEGFRGNTGSVTVHQAYASEVSRDAAAFACESMESLIVTVVDDYSGSWVMKVEGSPKIDYPKEFMFAAGPNDVAGNNRFFMSVTFAFTYLGSV